MEVTSSLSKTFKKFSIPRSTSSIGSFTTANGTATNVEQKFDETTSTQIPSFNGYSSNHKHPPLSYVQHIRPVQHLSQQNLSVLSSQKHDHHLTRPLSGDISSLMTRSISHSSNEHISKDNKVIDFLLSVLLKKI